MKCTLALETTTEAREIFGRTAAAAFVACSAAAALVPPRRNALIRLSVRFVSMINRANTSSKARFRHRDHRRIEVGFNAGQPQRTPAEQSFRGEPLGGRELVEPGVSLETNFGQLILWRCAIGPCRRGPACCPTRKYPGAVPGRGPVDADSIYQTPALPPRWPAKEPL